MAFSKRFIHIAGRSVPAIVVSASHTEPVQLASGKIIPGVFADMLSLRDVNPDGPNAGQPPYLALTRENLRFATLRTTEVVGLDVDKDGNPIPLEVLEAERGRQIEERQTQRLAAQAAPVVALD